MDETQQQLENIIDKLPEKLREFVRSGEWQIKLNSVLPKYSLATEQTEAIVEEVRLSLLGITDPDDLPVAFQAMAKITPEQAENLAIDIENDVFAPVNNELGKLDPLSLDEYRNGPEINEALAKLPKVLQEIIISTETADKIQAIGQKYQLHIDQMGALDEEINNVLFGILRADKLPEKIKTRLGVDQPTTDAIVHDLNDQIFLKIRESLQALHETTPSTELGASEPNYGVETLPGSTLPADQPAMVNLPNREEVIDGIENPAKTPEASVFEQKMGKLFRIPREEVDLDPYLEKPK
ncbi:MAG: hypothetical protein V1704_02170 [Candidatus Vogelbacteria bacterium]